MFLKIARWVPANGIVFAVLVVVATLLTIDHPGMKTDSGEIVSYYADSGNRSKELVALFLIGLAGLCFLSFLGSFRGVLARAEGEPARLTTAVTASGAAFIALALAAHGAGTTMALASDIAENFSVDPNTAKVTWALSALLFGLSLFAAAAMALSTTVLALQTRALPAWLAWTGALATVAGIFTIVWPPLSAIVLLWIAALSAWMLRPAPTAIAVAAT